MDFDFSNIINAVSEFFTEDPLGRVASVVTIATAIISFIIWIIKRIIKIIRKKTWRKNEISKLSEIADNEKIKLIKSKKYIPTMGQYEPPHDGENILISSSRFSLLKKLLVEFESKADSFDKNRYIIMGGSGMGKSTFLAALFYKYIKKCRLRKNTYPIYIKSLANPKVIEDISKIKDGRVNQSILLLDALDENIQASKDLAAFMKDLESVSHDFRFVIITCRTQFYKDAENEPHTWSIPVSGASNNRRIQYNRIYISPFNDNEVDTYLKEKYGSAPDIYRKARNIANKSIDIMSRPMVLSFMDDLIDLNDNGNDNITTVEIYYRIIEKWFEREIEINTDVTKAQLISFSKCLAIYMYDQWRASKELFLSEFQYNRFIVNNGYEKDPYSYEERSLVNRTSNGERKFSHRSFWEFFLAIDSFEHPGKQYIAKGLDMAKSFHADIYRLYNNKKLLDCINYLDFLYSKTEEDFSDIAINHKINQIKKLSPNPNKKAFADSKYLCHLIYELWEMFLRRLRNQYAIIDDYFNISLNDSKEHNIEKLFKYHYYYNNINKILDVFLAFYDNPYTNTIYKIRYLISDIEKNIIEITNNDLISERLMFKSMNNIAGSMERYQIRRELFVYPNYVQQIPHEIDNVYTIHIGLGFNKIEDIKESIDYLYNCLTTPLLIIHIDVNTLNELIELTSKINSSFIEKRRIIFRVFFNNTFVDYVNEWSNKKDTDNKDNKCNENERTLHIIQNMIKAKNYQKKNKK